MEVGEEMKSSGVTLLERLQIEGRICSRNRYGL